MANSAKKPFKTLAVRHNAEEIKTSIFTIDDSLGSWIDACDDTIHWNEFLVYGMPDKQDELDEFDEMDDELDDDFTSATQIGRILGCHIPKSLIVNLDADPYVVCDDVDGDLEAMYSVLQEYEDDFFEYDSDIYYIHEIELDAEYQGLGYEKILLLQLPAIIVKALRVFPSLLMYFPRPTQYEEPECDLEAESILMHRLEYGLQKAIKSGEDNNISLFPPRHEVPEKEINRILGRRNPGTVVPEACRNHDLYKLYKSAGFKEIGKTGWLCKPIASIYTKDGLYHND